MQTAVSDIVFEKAVEAVVENAGWLTAAPVALLLWVAALRSGGAFMKDLLRSRVLRRAGRWLRAGLEGFRTVQRSRYGHRLVVRVGLPVLISVCCLATGLMLLALSVVLLGNVVWVSLMYDSNAVPLVLYGLAVLSPIGVMIAGDSLVNAWSAGREAVQQLTPSLPPAWNRPIRIPVRALLRRRD